MRSSPITELPKDLAHPRGYRNSAIASIVTAVVLAGILTGILIVWGATL
jgi:hypothetical protein